MNCYQIVIINIVSFMRNVLGVGVYRGHSQPGADLMVSMIRSHSNSRQINKTYNSRLLVVGLTALLQMAISMPSYAASYSPDVLRVYLHSRIINNNEYKCMDKIIYKESRYNYLARNGSHYGLGQMRSKHYQSKDPFTQLDLTIAYSLKRYKSLCKAWAFHLKHGYY